MNPTRKKERYKERTAQQDKLCLEKNKEICAGEVSLITQMPQKFFLFSMF